MSQFAVEPDRSTGYQPIAIGGSGTRIVAGLLRDAGVFIGHRNNNTLDFIDLAPVLNARIQPALEQVSSADYDLRDIAALVREPVVPMMRAAMRASRHDALDEAWGFKNPRIIYLLPFLQEIFPRFVFIYALRDGRDMALSFNQPRFNLHGQLLIGTTAGGEAEAAAFWRHITGSVLDFRGRAMPDRLLFLRHEDLLRRPTGTANELFAFLEDTLAVPAFRTLGRSAVGIRHRRGFRRRSWLLVAKNRAMRITRKISKHGDPGGCNA